MTDPTSPSPEPIDTTADQGWPQAGIISRPPEHMLIGAFNFTDGIDPATALTLVSQLRELFRRELRSDIDELTPADEVSLPTKDTGTLGVADGFDRGHLSITIGFSRPGLRLLGVSDDDQPQDLIDEPPWSVMGDTTDPWDRSPGHMVVQLCSDDVYVVEHTLRRIEHVFTGRLVTKWTVVGAQRYTSRQGRVAGREARALIGFHDGLSNLDPAHNDADKQLVFVNPDLVSTYPRTPVGQQGPPQVGQPAYSSGNGGPRFPDDLRQPPTREPDWTRGGTYMFIRASIMEMAGWDEANLDTQQKDVGRFKYSGAPLDRPNDPANLHDEPDFASNPANTTVPFNSHVRKSNPRSSAEDSQRRIFRRGYPLVAGSVEGSLRRGLLFVSFSRTLSVQPEFIFRGWLRNKDFPTADAGVDTLLARDTRVVGGGYYFVPPLEEFRDAGSFRLPPIGSPA
ncbi:MAG: Dyp-type peroxidase [Actinomycetia bacterium]|nr:Dyp-type peroxidase [Actinomycetes bacterium]